MEMDQVPSTQSPVVVSNCSWWHFLFFNIRRI